MPPRVLLLLLALCLGIEVTCKDNGDCTNKQTEVDYTCDFSNGDCNCGDAKVCRCKRNNGKCNCERAQVCECDFNNGDCNCGKSLRCNCGNGNGACCAMPNISLSYDGFRVTASDVKTDSTGCYSEGLGGGSVAGIVIGCLVFVGVCGCVYYSWYRAENSKRLAAVKIPAASTTASHNVVQLVPPPGQPVYQPGSMEQPGFVQSTLPMGLPYNPQIAWTNPPQPGYMQLEPSGLQNAYNPYGATSVPPLAGAPADNPPSYDSSSGVLCNVCKHSNPSGSMFCVKCGERV